MEGSVVRSAWVRTAALVVALLLFLTGSAQAQISDNFNDNDDQSPVGASWTRFNPVGLGSWTSAGGTYRIASAGTTNVAVLGNSRAGSHRAQAAFADFSASVDVLDFNSSAANPFMLFYLAARMTDIGPGGPDGYAVAVRNSAPLVASTLYLIRVDNGYITPVASVPLPALTPATEDYRLVFEGTGASLTGKLYALSNLSTPINQVATVDALYASGVTGIGVFDSWYPNFSSTESFPTDATFDNFSATGPSVDTDGDGLSDNLELAIGTNPLIPDTDADGLTDGAEVNTYQTNPLAADTDADGFSDAFEVVSRADPLSSALTPPRLGFSRLDGGTAFSCGIARNGEILCWGDGTGGRLNAPTGTFRSLALGNSFGCALRTNNTIACWGTGSATTPPGSNYLQLAAGLEHACGLRPDLTIECWGDNSHGQLGAPPGQFSQVVAGDDHSCALDASGAPVCWGWNNAGQIVPPIDEAFVSLTAGTSHTCGLRGDGSVACWGSNASGQSAAPVESFTSLSAGSTHTCGIRTDGTAVCWGSLATVPVSNPPFVYSSLASGSGHVCGIKTGGTGPLDVVQCWGSNGSGQSTPPGVSLPAVGTGGPYGCAVTPRKLIRCWGSGTSGEATPPLTGDVVGVTTGSNHSCALLYNGDVVCWGSNASGKAANQLASGNPFVQIDAGGTNTCGVRLDGTASCWGSTSNGQSTPDPGLYQQVSVGNVQAPPTLGIACGVKTDGTIGCWGTNITEPGGSNWRQVSVGRAFACGVHTDGTLGCWGGSNSAGQLNSPVGSFSQVAAGSNSACALTLEGSVVCWGTLPGTLPPPGRYLQISAAVGLGGEAYCGVQSPSGAIACWGLDAADPSPALDLDDDNIEDGGDNCPGFANATQTDTDVDGTGDACDVCPSLPDPDQFDRDGDTVGDACDNCLNKGNVDQLDVFGGPNGIGDACESTLVFIRPNTPPPSPGPPPGAPFGPATPPPPPAGEALYDVFVYCPAFPIAKVQLGVIMPQGATSANVNFGLGCTATTCSAAAGNGLAATVNAGASLAKGPDPAFASSGARGDTVYFSIQANAGQVLCPSTGPTPAIEVRVAQFQIANPLADMPTPSLTKEGLSAPPVNLLQPLVDDTGRVLEPAEYSFASVNDDPTVALTLAPAPGGVPGHRWQVELDTDIELDRVTFGLVAPAGTTTAQMRFIGCTTASGPQPTRRSCTANTALGPYVAPATSYSVGPGASTSGLRTDTLYVSVGGARASGAALPALNIATQPVVLGVVELDTTTAAPALTLDGVGTTAVFGPAYVDSGNTTVTTPLVQVGGGYNAPSDYDADGRSDDLDNCPYTANANQANNGGFLTATPDLYGDLCQCADGDGNGAVAFPATASDTAALRAVLTGQAGPAVVARCSVAGGPECDIRDYVVFKRALAGLAPGISSVCASAVRTQLH